LQRHSEDFTQGLTPSNATLTANQGLAPNGTITADQFLETTANGLHSQEIADHVFIAGAAYTFSCYAKSIGGRNFAPGFPTLFGSARFGFFNLSGGGSVVNTDAGVTASIQAVGDGWYRCSITSTCVTGGGARVGVFIASGTSISYVGDAAKGLLLWGAQLEQSSTVGEYIPTTSTINSAPRFDHNPTTGESLGLLVEEQRTNLLVQSSFGSIGTTTANNTWYETFAELDTTVNAGLAPDGTTTAALLSINTPTSFRSVIQRTTSTTAGTYALSIYLKPNSTDTSARVMLSGDTGASNFVRADFTLSGAGTAPGSAGVGGTAVSAAAPTIQALPNGWYRCTIAGTLTAPTGITIFVYPGTTGSQTTNSQTLVWGAQLEAGSFPTSYIPTTTATVTRSADVASITGSNFSSWYRQDEGTWFAQHDVRNVILSANNNSFSERQPQMSLGAGLAHDFYSITGGVIQANSVGPAHVIGTPSRVVFALKANDFIGALNGTLFGADTSGSFGSLITQLNIGSLHNGAGTSNGTIRRLTYFPTRLPNSTLQQITQ
jgi:hypothetical protein